MKLSPLLHLLWHAAEIWLEAALDNEEDDDGENEVPAVTLEELNAWNTWGLIVQRPKLGARRYNKPGLASF